MAKKECVSVDMLSTLHKRLKAKAKKDKKTLFALVNDMTTKFLAKSK